MISNSSSSSDRGRYNASDLRLLLAAAALLCLTPALFSQAPAALAGGAHYSIVQGSQTLGDAQYSITPISGGYTVSSSGHMALAKFTYGFRNQGTLDTSFNLVRDSLTGSVNGSKVHASNIAFSTNSDPTGRDFQINISADGKQSTNSVDRHRNTVLMPDLDPAAYTLMARLAVAQPQTAWILIPKENGLLVPAAYQPQSDVEGVLNGKNVKVRHATAELSDANSITLELYYLPDGQLLEADLNAQNLDVVHDGFKLLEHPAPTPPPPGQSPQQQPGVGTPPQQQ